MPPKSKLNPNAKVFVPATKKDTELPRPKLIKTTASYADVVKKQE